VRPDGGEKDEFFAFAVACGGHPPRDKANPNPTITRIGMGMLSQSTDDWALRLHSCRAVSSLPHSKPTKQNLEKQTLKT
jgi:hypothetical protein